MDLGEVADGPVVISARAKGHALERLVAQHGDGTRIVEDRHVEAELQRLVHREGMEQTGPVAALGGELHDVGDLDEARRAREDGVDARVEEVA